MDPHAAAGDLRSRRRTLLLAVAVGLGGCAYGTTQQRFSSPGAVGAVVLPFNEAPRFDDPPPPAEMRAPIAAVVPTEHAVVVVVPCDFTDRLIQVMLFPPVPIPIGQTITAADGLIIAIGFETPRQQWRVDLTRIWLEQGGARIAVGRWGREPRGPMPWITASGRTFHACRNASRPPHDAGSDPVDFPLAADDHPRFEVPLAPDVVASLARATPGSPPPLDSHRFDATLWLEFGIAFDPGVPATLHLDGIGFGGVDANVPPVELRPASRRFGGIVAP